jgi:uncharacterized membrane protein YcaP (DUF421 family)
MQVLLRAVVVFFSAIVIARIASKRFFAGRNAFDVMLGLILGSMLGRAINGSEEIWATICAGFALAILHRLLGYFACRWKVVGTWLKGHSEDVVVNSTMNQVVMRQHDLSEEDLREELRLKGLGHLGQVERARLERNGEVSVIRKDHSG